jgi:glycosyltransferase involved in cell wall biosynthesis
MRLTYIHQHFTTTDGSSGTRSYEASKAMVAHGHDVTVICGNFEHGVTGIDLPFKGNRRQAMVSGINVVEFDLSYGNRTSFLRRISLFLRFAWLATIELHRLPRADVVYATSTPVTVAIPALWAKLRWRVPFVFEVRDLWPEIPIAMGVLRNRLLIGISKWLVKAAYRHSEYCITLSPGMTDGVLALEPRARTVMIPNGSDTELFTTDYESALQDVRVSKWLSDIDFSSAKLNLVYAGAIGYANHLESLLDAIKLIDSPLKEKVHFFVIGDGGFRTSLEVRVIELGLSESVSIVDPVPKTLLFQALCVFDAGMLLLRDVPDFREGTSPNKFFDYLAAGLPVLANFQGWIASLLDDRGAGLSCPSGSPEYLAEVISNFALKSHEEKILMRRASRSLATQFDRKTIVLQQSEVCEAAAL